jgi:hypothetical protein
VDLLRIGTLGSSRISEPALIEPAASVPEVTVAAVAARDKSRADAFALRHYRAAGLLPRPTAERG